ncbi:MAG: hypothetical protein ABIP39_11790, partial [Polyangiaceae bacterium]
MMRARQCFQGPLLAILFGAMLLHCAKPDGGAAAATDAGTPVDTEVMAFLSEARALHHETNVHEDSGELKEGIASLDRLVHAKRPHEGTKVPEVEEVLADTYARLADLRLRAGDVDGASRDVREGMTHAPDPTYFRGHLLEVDGIVEEARGASLADAGKRDEAQKARSHAIERLREAVEIQERVV